MSSEVDRHVRKFVFDRFLSDARAPVVEEIMVEFKMNRVEASAALERLELAHHVVRVPGTRRILMANPFSALDSPFRVEAMGRSFFGACAWDAVAYHVMLGAPTKVTSFCHHCADPIVLEFSEGKTVKADPVNPLVYISIPAAKWWDNIVLTCSNNMVFFHSRDHLDEWLESNPSEKGEALTIEQTLRISLPLYREKLNLDYERPSKEALTEYWTKMGLTGEFWKL